MLFGAKSYKYAAHRVYIDILEWQETGVELCDDLVRSHGTFMNNTQKSRVIEFRSNIAIPSFLLLINAEPEISVFFTTEQYDIF
jgi:hypothetical protein